MNEVASIPSLKAVIAEVCRTHKFHTLVLYGSHARGEGGRGSDFDLLAIRKGGKPLRDARYWRGTYLDIFVYPESKVKARDFMQVRGGRVLMENDAKFGTKLLAAIERRYAKGPPALPADQRQVEIVWTQKTLERARRGDVEGNFRRVWLLSALLQNYFALRQLWYEGPKRSLSWLEVHDPQTAKLFAAALKPNAGLSALTRLVRAVNAGLEKSRKKSKRDA